MIEKNRPAGQTAENDGAGNRQDPVRDHYEKWPFPDVYFAGREALVFLRYLTDVLTGTPGRKAVLDAGCGTGHGTIAIARLFPDIAFVGVDLSAASIERANETARSERVSNVTFVRGDLLDLESLPTGPFQLGISAGVLHHIEDGRTAFANLARRIVPGGRVVLWLYGRYGRYRHGLNRSFLELLAGSKSLEERERLAHEFVRNAESRYLLDSGFYTPHGSGREGLAWLRDHRHWLADQMIPPFERGYTMPEVLALLGEQDFSFERWLGVSTDPADHLQSELLRAEFSKLSFAEQLTAIDYLVKPEYYFVAGRKEKER